MISDLGKVKTKVEYLLDKYPATRDSDKMLWLAYIVIFEGVKSLFNKKQYEEFKKKILNAPTPESLTRVRRKFQEQGLYVSENREERMREAQKVSEWSQKNGTSS